MADAPASQRKNADPAAVVGMDVSKHRLDTARLHGRAPSPAAVDNTAELATPRSSSSFIRFGPA